MKPCLAGRVTRIGNHQQARIEKRLFGLALCDAVFLVLARVAGIPFESDDALERPSELYITMIYVGVKRTSISHPADARLEGPRSGAYAGANAHGSVTKLAAHRYPKIFARIGFQAAAASFAHPSGVA